MITCIEITIKEREKMMTSKDLKVDNAMADMRMQEEAKIQAYSARFNEIKEELEKYSDKSSYVTILLTFFPILGLHRMTNGKFLSGLLFAITGGGLFIWWFIDMGIIASGKFKDKNGKYINTPKVTGLEIELNSLEEEIRKSRIRIQSL